MELTFCSPPLRCLGFSTPTLVIDNHQPPSTSWNSNRIRRRASRFLKKGLLTIASHSDPPPVTFVYRTVRVSSWSRNIVLAPSRISCYNIRSRSLYLSSPRFFFFGKHQLWSWTLFGLSLLITLPTDPSVFLWTRHIPIVVVVIHLTTTVNDTRHTSYPPLHTVYGRWPRVHRVGPRLLASVNPSTWTHNYLLNHSHKQTRQLEFEFENGHNKRTFTKNKPGREEERGEETLQLDIETRVFLFLFSLSLRFLFFVFFCSGLITSWLWDF